MGRRAVINRDMEVYGLVLRAHLTEPERCLPPAHHGQVRMASLPVEQDVAILERGQRENVVEWAPPHENIEPSGPVLLEKDNEVM